MDTVMPTSGVCWKLVRRQVVDEMLDILLFYNQLVGHWGFTMSLGRCFHSKSAYYSAAARLKKQGVIARRSTRHRPSQLIALDAAHERLPDFYRAEQFWNKRWNGIWFILMYDVPETQRVYRDSLRTFLKRYRMGCLQRSVWATPNDIRAEYHDLCEASEVDAYSFLLEARTLMGRSAQDLAREAWNFSRLYEGHHWYLNTYRNRMRAVQLGQLPPASIMHTVREELAAFVTVTQDDPLLPRELYPDNYLGPEVLAFHKDFMRIVGEAGVRLWPAVDRLRKQRPPPTTRG